MLDTPTRDRLDVATPASQDDLMLNLRREDGSLKTLTEIEDEVMRIYLIVCLDSMAEAACSLGIGRSTLYRKLTPEKIEPALD